MKKETLLKLQPKVIFSKCTKASYKTCPNITGTSSILSIQNTQTAKPCMLEKLVKNYMSKLLNIFKLTMKEGLDGQGVTAISSLILKLLNDR